MKTREQEFVISYTGDALVTGRMSVRELAPALLALSDIVEAAGRLELGDKGEVRLDIKATNIGSFEIVLQLVQSFPHQILDIFNSDSANALLNIVEVLGLGTSGLFWLLKLARGRTPKRKLRVDDANVRIEFEDGDEVMVSKRTFELYSDVKVRRSAYDVVKPLQHEGIDGLYLGTGQPKHQAPDLFIKKEDVDYFIPPVLGGKEILSIETEIHLSIVSLAFKEDNKWRVTDGNKEFYVRILDDEFTRRVQNGHAAFSINDVLRVRMLTQQWQTESGLKTEYVIVRVLEHISGFQTKLSFDEE